MDSKRTLLGVLLVIAVCGPLTWTLRGFGVATLTTDQKLYSVGQNYRHIGLCVSPNALVAIAVESPDHRVESSELCEQCGLGGRGAHVALRGVGFSG
jgi:hypothetical protein